MTISSNSSCKPNDELFCDLPWNLGARHELLAGPERGKRELQPTISSSGVVQQKLDELCLYVLQHTVKNPTVVDRSWCFADWSHCTELSWHFINIKSSLYHLSFFFSFHIFPFNLSLYISSSFTHTLSLSLSLTDSVCNCLWLYRSHLSWMLHFNHLPLLLWDVDEKRVNKWLMYRTISLMHYIYKYALIIPFVFFSLAVLSVVHIWLNNYLGHICFFARVAFYSGLLVRRWWG